jgi:hypothetical protein
VSRESFLPHFAAESLKIINNAVIITVLHNLKLHNLFQRRRCFEAVFTRKICNGFFARYPLLEAAGNTVPLTNITHF